MMIYYLYTLFNLFMRNLTFYNEDLKVSPRKDIGILASSIDLLIYRKYEKLLLSMMF